MCAPDRCLTRGAHPRWRGEDCQVAARVTLRAGSSPLARGGLRRPPRLLRRRRLIPAGAGRTKGPHPARGGGSAHPRWRGEDDRGQCAGSWRSGSSPLARGGPLPRVARRRRQGLIPAGAGRTCDIRGCHTVTRAHPRWRGEDRKRKMAEHNSYGSSPLARGGRTSGRSPMQFVGLIPAGAGRTRSEDLGVAQQVGSSPLARGGRRRAGHRPAPAGLIPAGAGRTQEGGHADEAHPAHPRWRGEDRSASRTTGHGPGSSPLARGGPGSRAGSGTGAGAHPRWRGEDSCRLWRPRRRRGSSPLARGGQLQGRSGCIPARLIPAGAGRTFRSPTRRPRIRAHPRWRGEDRCY